MASDGVDRADSAGNRATVALVSEKVDALRQLTDNRTADIQRRLNTLDPLPEKVARLEEQVKDLEDWRRDEHDEQSRGLEWRRGPLLAVLITAAGIAVNLLIALQHTGATHPHP